MKVALGQKHNSLYRIENTGGSQEGKSNDREYSIGSECGRGRGGAKRRRIKFNNSNRTNNYNKLVYK